MKVFHQLVIAIIGGIIIVSEVKGGQVLDAATDPRINPKVRAFLTELNKDSSPFWELPQPKPQEILTALQNKTAVDMSGVTVTQRTISEGGRSVKLYIMTPQAKADRPGVLYFVQWRSLDRREL
jgi:hypothetical protein